MKRLESSIKDLRARPKVEASVVIARMREHASETKWVYAEDPIYAFHAKLPMPPEMTMVTLKRFWSGQITAQEIVDTCRRYQVEQLLLSRTKMGAEWNDLLRDYSMVYEDKDIVLYVAKRLGSR